ncbi:uncharacterized protein LOC131047042 isoform X1 [Cryptomeria japonica]|uniref:uncharacterized protein LOC131047042 isoform X1 n=1 Tax=Cryptomeria japonica TaxID=3369 RepID=UPI0025AB9DDF|nr:uncharacterized protein LOC131047042 isoform X1 [Cryptomeria japonica]
MQLPREELPGAEALASFCREDDAKCEFTEELRGILEVISRTGKYWHNWTMLKKLLSFRLKQVWWRYDYILSYVLTEYHESLMAVDSAACENLIAGETYPELVSRLEEALDCFVEGPPFTLQRLCEILLKPQSIYPNISKASLALEKILLVTSTLPVSIDPYPSFSLSSSYENGPKQNGSHDTAANTNEVPNTTEVANAAEASNTAEVAKTVDAIITDEEMIDASMDVDEKSETNERNGDLDAFTKKTPEIPCNGD